MNGYRSTWYTDDVAEVGELALTFLTKELVPNRDRWEQQQHVDRDFWNKAGDVGLLCTAIPAEYGGGGGTMAHELSVQQAQGRVLDTSWGYAVHSTIVAHYILDYGTEEQKQRWLPRMATGELVAAVAMSEPAAGSDLQGIQTRARREGDTYVVNGAKTFISNGQLTNLIVIVAKTDPTAGAKGTSLLVLEGEHSPGFTRGRVLNKVGQHGQDTSELFFDDVVIPAENLLGGVEGRGFVQLMQQLPQERLTIATSATVAMEMAVEETVRYAKDRTAFGQRLFDFQNTRFVLAEAATRAHAARVFLDSCIERHLRGELDATTAAMAKWWLTEEQCQVIDKLVQIFGGYGYMTEFPIARLYADARVQKIYGGANEIMKELVARSL